MKVSFLILCGILILRSAYGQQEKIQLQYFSFMVIPYLEEGEKIGEKLKNSPDLRNSIAVIEEVFLKQGFQVYDFASRYEFYNQNASLQEESFDSKTDFLNFASPDIYCELDVKNIDCGQNEHKARITFKSYLTNSGRLLNNKTDDSNCFEKDASFLDLVKNVSWNVLDEYVVRLEESLDLMGKQGQPVSMSITIDNNASFNFDSEVTINSGDFSEEGGLAEIISYWLDDHEHVKYFKVVGQTSKLMRIEDLRLPLLNESKDRVYNIEKFNRTMRRFLGQLKFTDFPGIDKMDLKITRINGVTIAHLTN